MCTPTLLRGNGEFRSEDDFPWRGPYGFGSYLTNLENHSDGSAPNPKSAIGSDKGGRRFYDFYVQETQCNVWSNH
jgi:hypothetical protein